jgi:hypothetical protein
MVDNTSLRRAFPLDIIAIVTSLEYPSESFDSDSTEIYELNDYHLTVGSRLYLKGSLRADDSLTPTTI